MDTQSKKQNKALLVAYYFINKNCQDKKGLDNKKLQKLLYYAQAWNLVFNKKPLFSDRIEAWIYGPVVPSVWRTFKAFDFDFSNCIIPQNIPDSFDESEKKILDDVWGVYGKFDGDYLELLTHNELPWQEARKDTDNLERSQNEISLEIMKEYYQKKLTDALAKRHQETKE